MMLQLTELDYGITPRARRLETACFGSGLKAEGGGLEMKIETAVAVAAIMCAIYQQDKPNEFSYLQLYLVLLSASLALCPV